MTYRYLEHTADIGVEVVAPTCAQAFSEAGLALFGIMTDSSKVAPDESVEISASGEDIMALLYEWLEELIYIFDTSGMILVRIEIKGFDRDPPRIQAVGFGQRFDPRIHESRTGVKAITYHRMAVETTEKGCVLRYFVDI